MKRAVWHYINPRSNRWYYCQFILDNKPVPRHDPQQEQDAAVQDQADAHVEAVPVAQLNRDAGDQDLAAEAQESDNNEARSDGGTVDMDVINTSYQGDEDGDVAAYTTLLDPPSPHSPVIPIQHDMSELQERDR